MHMHSWGIGINHNCILALYYEQKKGKEYSETFRSTDKNSPLDITTHIEPPSLSFINRRSVTHNNKGTLGNFAIERRQNLVHAIDVLVDIKRLIASIVDRD